MYFTHRISIPSAILIISDYIITLFCHASCCFTQSIVAQNKYSTRSPTPCRRLWCWCNGVLVFSAAAIFLASVHGKCLRYTEDVDVVFTKKNSSLFTLERGRWIRMLCDSSNLHKQKFVKPKPLASKMAAVKKVGQKNGEVGLLVEYLFCARSLVCSAFWS